MIRHSSDVRKCSVELALNSMPGMRQSAMGKRVELCSHSLLRSTSIVATVSAAVSEARAIDGLLFCTKKDYQMQLIQHLRYMYVLIL